MIFLYLSLCLVDTNSPILVATLYLICWYHLAYNCWNCLLLVQIILSLYRLFWFDLLQWFLNFYLFLHPLVIFLSLYLLLVNITLTILVTNSFYLPILYYTHLYNIILVLIPLLLLVEIIGMLLLVSSPRCDLFLLVYLHRKYDFVYPCSNCIILFLISLLLLVAISGAILLVVISLVLPIFLCFWSTISDTKNYNKGSTSKKYLK